MARYKRCRLPPRSLCYRHCSVLKCRCWVPQMTLTDAELVLAEQARRQRQEAEEAEAFRACFELTGKAWHELGLHAALVAYSRCLGLPLPWRRGDRSRLVRALKRQLGAGKVRTTLRGIRLMTDGGPRQHDGATEAETGDGGTRE